MRRLTIAAGLCLAALPALADPPDDIVDLLGARAPGAETQMQARGYADVDGNTWWNDQTGVCVKVHVSQGRYKAIDMVTAADCGMKAMEDSDRPSPNEPDQAAVDACMNSADLLQEVELGTSVMQGAKRSGENWLLTMNTSGRHSRCTVTPSGDVLTIE